MAKIFQFIYGWVPVPLIYRQTYFRLGLSTDPTHPTRTDSTYARSNEIGCQWQVSKLNNGRSSVGSPPKPNLTRFDYETHLHPNHCPDWWRSLDLQPGGDLMISEQVFLLPSSSPLLPVSTETDLRLWTTDSTRFISSLWLTAGHIFYHPT